MATSVSKGLRPTLVLLSMLALWGCVSAGSSGGPVDTWADREQASRTYRASAAAEAALDQATAEVRALAGGEDRTVIEGYLADSRYRRQFATRYRDYLIDTFSVSEMTSMAEGTDAELDMERQVEAHRFLVASTLVSWHIQEAGLGPRLETFEDPLVELLSDVIRTTPRSLIPTSASSGQLARPSAYRA